jgi:hypothetical protein
METSNLTQNGYVVKCCAESLRVGTEEYGKQMQGRFREWKAI